MVATPGARTRVRSSEQGAGAALHSEMLVRERRGFAPARRPRQQPFLDQVRLVHVLQRLLVLRERGGERRHAHGEAVGTAKLTAEEVQEIREIYVTGGANQIELAELFGVTRSNIGFIVREKSWKHLI